MTSKKRKGLVNPRIGCSSEDKMRLVIFEWPREIEIQSVM